MAEQMTGVLSPDEIKEQVREFLAMNFRYDGENFELGDDTSLLGSARSIRPACWNWCCSSRRPTASTLTRPT